MLAGVGRYRPWGCDVRRFWALLSIIAVIGAAGLLTACGGDDDTGQATTESTTAAVSTQATTAAAPATTAPATTAPATTAPATTAGSDAAAKAGLVVFKASCTGCHMADGTEAGGVGPKLAGLGLTADAIRNQVVNGGGAMPGGLVSGDDLDAVTAYVVSIQ